MAFAPDYASSGRFYVDYTGTNGDLHVVQYRRAASDPNLADAASARAVLTIPHHRYTNHNGGQLQFGPDGDLYIGVGDGGNEDDPMNEGQNTDVLLGKVLRIAPGPNGGYSIPAGNPFAGRPGRRPEIWAYGLRNPWRFSFDRLTGALIIGDVGQDQQEEVDFAPRGTGAGANYGWSIFEGDRRNKPGTAPGAVFPVLVTLHSNGYCAIIGGYVVRDRSLPALVWPLRLRGPVQARDQIGRAQPGPRDRRSGDRPVGARHVVVRPGRARAHLCRVARRTRVPDGAGVARVTDDAKTTRDQIGGRAAPKSRESQSERSW